jgi:1-acyl-sn-glycerol-3-phosphate acyltransferase
MLDLHRLRSIHLRPRPKGQLVVGRLLLGPSYTLPGRTKILAEGAEHLPTEPAVLAMNHTDRYNYWPLQYWLWRKQERFTATWVKGKYYENKYLGKFMEMNNNIPAPSKGYIITRDFVSTVGRSPKKEEYAALRELAAGKSIEPGALPVEIESSPRDMLGRHFSPSKESYAECVRELLAEMNAIFMGLNEAAFEAGLDLLIFPQGTRSIRLSKGHIGMVQAALHFKRGIVPIGCNGSDKIYPGGSPWAKSGTIVYRIGEYMPYESFAEYHLPEGLNPFDPEVARTHREQMQGLVDKVMDRINDLLDPEYQFGEGDGSDGVEGSRRFV